MRRGRWRVMRSVGRWWRRCRGVWWCLGWRRLCKRFTTRLQTATITTPQTPQTPRTPRTPPTIQPTPPDSECVNGWRGNTPSANPTTISPIPSPSSWNAPPPPPPMRSSTVPPNALRPRWERVCGVSRPDPFAPHVHTPLHHPPNHQRLHPDHPRPCPATISCSSLVQCPVY